MADGAATPAESGIPAVSRSAPRWRRILVTTLVVVGCVFAPISVMGVWLRNTLLNTDQYVATIGPVASNSDVQNAVANRVTNELVQGSNVDARIKDALPPKASFVVPYLGKGIQQFVHGLALRLVQSPKFAQLWNILNRRAHTQLVAALKGQGSGKLASATKNGKVVLDLGPVIDKVNQALSKQGITGLSNKAPANKQLVLFSSSDLASVQGAVRLLNDLAIALPIITGLFFIAAIVLSPKRRRTILRGALGLALAMALMLIVFNLARSVYLNALPAGVDHSAAQAVYNQLLSFLRLSLRTLFVFGVVVALAAWLSGPGELATRIRTGGRDLVRRAPGEGVVSPKVAASVDRYRTALRGSAVGIGLAILVALTAPGPLAVLVIAILVLLVLAVIELLRRGAAQPARPSAKSPGTG